MQFINKNILKLKILGGRGVPDFVKHQNFAEGDELPDSTCENPEIIHPLPKWKKYFLLKCL